MERSIVIGVFCYNRAAKLRRCVEALLRNPECSSLDIVFFSDGFKTQADKAAVLEVRNYIESLVGFKNVIKHFREQNFSTGPNFEVGLRYLTSNYDEFIIVEDDLVDALEFYKSEQSVFCITGYVFPLKLHEYAFDTVVYKRFCSYGWAGWSNRLSTVIWNNDLLKQMSHDSRGFKRRLNREGWDLGRMLTKQVSGKISTWDIQMQTHVAVNRLKVIYPVLSKVINIGFDNESTNTFGINYLVTPIDPGITRTFKFCHAEMISSELQSQLKKPYGLKQLIFRKVINECIAFSKRIKRVLYHPNV
jgi:glycosyltransferase involved in cell wall biosynthesis